MKKNFFKMFLFGFVSLFVSNEFVAAANDPIQISYGTVFNFIQGAMYDGVKCDIPADTGDFIFTTTTYSDDHYVEVQNPNAASGTLSFECSYTKKRAHSGANAPVVSTDGVEKFVFEIVPPKDLTKFNMELHRQFRYFVDMKTYFTVGTNTGIDSIQLSSELQSVFENSSGSVTCNSQSCIMYLKQDAKVGITTGKIKYGNYEFELTVNVKDEWVVYANTGGYGRCDFEEVGGGWELNGKNSNFFEKAISGKTVALPRCVADNTFDNRYMALEFVGWVYNKKSVNDNYNNYQSIDVCATFKDNSDPNIGFVSGGGTISPSQMTFAHRGNSIFYACYKKTGIGFNLLGAKVNDDTYQITKWNLTQREGDVTPGIYYKVFDDNTSTMVLPSKVEPSGLVDNEVFVGWINNRDGYDKVIPGGTEVSVKEGLIYTPHFMIEKAETERSVTVYTKNKIVIELPSSFTCVSGEKTNFSVVGSGNKCVITGIKSSNGDHLDYPIKNGNKTYTLKILVVEGSYSDNENIPPVEIGNGDLIVDDDDGEGNVSVTNPVDCKTYYVGHRGETIESRDLFIYENVDHTVKYGGHIFTYYARSACYGEQYQLETEYAALCLDPGRASPPRSITGKKAKNGESISVSKYYFDRYIDVNDSERDYREFSKAVAHIVSKLGVVSLDDFNEENNDKKIAANIALRIVATQYPLISVKPSNGDVKYVNAFMAYQSMAMHLGFDGDADHSNIGKDKPIKGVPENSSICDTNARSLYIGCNHEWTWQFDTLSTSDNGATRTYTRADLLNLIGEYLSYGANESLEKDNWELVPKLKYERREGNTVHFILTYPRSIQFRYGENSDYDITVNLSDRMAKVYQIEDYWMGTSYHTKCIDTVMKDNKCHRYAVRLNYDISPQAPYATHEIVLKLMIDESAPMIFPDPEARDIYLEVGYSSAYTSQSAFLVEPLSAGDYQRMVLFNPEKVVKIFPLNIYDCNVLLQNYGNDSSKYEQIYKAGCCETISDGSTEYQDFVNTYCKKDCVMNNYKPVCQSGDNVKDYKIHEAMTKQGTTNFACIVDVRNMGSLTTSEQLSVLGGGSGEKEPFTNTSNMTDINGQNSIAISAFKDNPYCRVTCKEDWEFNMPGYGDFLGANAVAAGSLFQINHSINLKSTVTCVTSHIDVAGYQRALNDLTKNIYEEYEAYSLRSATHDDIDVRTTNNTDYVWYTYSYTKDIPCGISQVNAGISTCSISGEYRKQCSNNVDDYNGHSECRTGSYDSSPACTKEDVVNGVSGCSASGKYKNQSTYNTCMANHGTDETCKTACTKDTMNQAGCVPSGNKVNIVKCGYGNYYEDGCGVDTSKSYKVSDCTASDYVNGSFNKSGLSHNCSINGKYMKVTQTTRSGAGMTEFDSCRQYEIYTKYTKPVNVFKLDGSPNGTKMHSFVVGNLKTNYSMGNNVCGSSGTCEKANNFSTDNDGVCQTRYSKGDADGWKKWLISNRATYLGDDKLIESSINEHHGKYITNLENLSKLSNEFAKCQNFNIYNKTIASENSSYKTPLIYNNSGKLYNTGATGITLNNPISSSLNIDTKLEPSGTFGYDEDYYMDLMADDRVIAKNSSINYTYKTEMYNDQSIRNGFTSCYGSEGEYLAADGSVRSCSESIDYTAGTISVNSNIAGVPKAFEFVLCNINNDYSYSTNSDLCTKTLFYYYDVNYVKQSLTSSASYDNNITWYRYTANDKIFPGKGMGTDASKADAASRYSNYSLTEDEYNLWSAMGTKNVFPVSLNTRRNIYQYYYTFKGIGNYYNGAYASDRNSIGRLMGYEDSIIKSNSRVCFYEVYESACICCGQNDLGVVSSGSGINSYEYVGYTPSGMGSGSGHYGFTTSTVSLYNLKGFSSNVNSSNWSAGETYFYDGSNKYKTDKGKELAGYIEQKGENVYAEIPEYSYVLTPNAMANIRKNNTEGKYGYGRDTIYAVENGTYLAHSGNKNHIPNSNETSRIIFTHFGSNFVKNELSAYETPEYKGKLLSNMSMSSECYVEKNGISSMEDKKKKGCKWVDYVQPVNPDGSGGYFRMAFK